MAKDWKVGVDIGGTFTDVIAVDRSRGLVRSAKVLSGSQQVTTGLTSAIRAIDLEWDEVGELVLGTTAVTNAIVEDKLARVALIATRGFGDTIEIGRQDRRELYCLDSLPRPVPQVPGERRFEVNERLDPDGVALAPLEPESVDDAIRGIEEQKVDAVAVSLLHAYANPDHEESIGDKLRKRLPCCALSNRISPEAREYERTATTVLSAGVMPLVAQYLDDIEAVRPASTGLRLCHSAGGMATPETVRELPLGLALSGPAAGVSAAANIALALGAENAISLDMGGTTTDVCLIRHGKADITSDRALAGRPLRQPMIAVESIGAGGGSIARLDHGALRVGPESAGADPGPVCYGLGGTAATVTDANLVLGYLEDDHLLGGDTRLDANAARGVIAPLARQMRITVEQAALGIVEVANAAMLRALRRVSVERGVDGRDCLLIAGGGAGPMHAVALARAFSMAKVLIPAHSGVLSAFGCVDAAIGYTRQQTLRMRADQWNGERVNRARSALTERLAASLGSGDARTRMQVEETAAIRYLRQSYAVEVVNPAFDDPDRLGKSFAERHRQLYGFATDEAWELTSLRVRVSLPTRPVGALTAPEAPTSGSERVAPCVFSADGPLPTPRLARASLTPGASVAGPAIIEDDGSTIVLPPGASLAADSLGHLHIETGVAP